MILRSGDNLEDLSKGAWGWAELCVIHCWSRDIAGLGSVEIAHDDIIGHNAFIIILSAFAFRRFVLNIE